MHLLNPSGADFAAQDAEPEGDVRTSHAAKPIAQIGWRRFHSLEELECWARALARRRAMLALRICRMRP